MVKDEDPGALGDMLLDPLVGSPALTKLAQVAFPFAAAPAVWPAGLLQRARMETERDQLRDPGRVGRRHEGHERGTALPPEHRRTFDPGVVHDGKDVVLHHLQSREVLGIEPVGQADTAPVQDGNPGERAQPGKHPPELGQLPVPVEVGDETRDAHQVDGSLAEDLIRDRDVAIVRVAHVGAIPHRQPPPAGCLNRDHRAPGHLRTDLPQDESRNDDAARWRAPAGTVPGRRPGP
jgi:hypothetical protein